MRVKIAPSILSADFGKLAEELKMVEAAGAGLIHIDVMDGHFVPNLTYGPPIIRKCKEITSLPLDVHLMISNAEASMDSYISAGADYICVHVEAVQHLERTLNYIKSHNVKAGAALNPSTPPDTLSRVIEVLDFVLVMSVNPGFEAQKFIPASIDKINHIHRMLSKKGCETEIAVDGGVSPSNAGALARAGATILVAGSAIFKSRDPGDAIRQIARSAEE